MAKLREGSAQCAQHGLRLRSFVDLSIRTKGRRPSDENARGDVLPAGGAQHPGTYLNAKYRRIAARRGPLKANVAVQHAMLTAIWHTGTTGALHDDPGADYYTRLHPDRAKRRAIHQLEAIGYRVTLDAS